MDACCSRSPAAAMAVNYQCPLSLPCPTRVRFPQQPFPLARRRVSVRAVADVETPTVTTTTTELDLELRSPPIPKQKSKSGVKQASKRQVMLKFVWMDKNVGLAIDQVIPGNETVPLSPYYFWPRKDAWEELKTKLESKSWISKKQTILLLNQATDIINLWQQNASNL